MTVIPFHPRKKQVDRGPGVLCPGFADKIKEMMEHAITDPGRAEQAFSEAQLLAKAFWAGVEYACGVEE